MKANALSRRRLEVVWGDSITDLRQSAVSTKMAKVKQTTSLKDWQQIAGFLGQPTSVAQRWAKSGMPIAREGRSVHSSREELNRWLGRESAGEPIHIATESDDLSSELKRGLSLVREHGNEGKKKQSPPAAKKRR
jgi:hypothetical protein